MHPTCTPQNHSIKVAHYSHVVADYVSFATTFLLKSHRLTHAIAPPFLQKVTLAATVRLCARSQRLRGATKFLRVQLYLGILLWHLFCYLLTKGKTRFMIVSFFGLYTLDTATFRGLLAAYFLKAKASLHYSGHKTNLRLRKRCCA